jgi:hypothetical protein
VSRRRNRHSNPRERREPKRPRERFVRRPFEGLADEAEWVALRELVPAATAPLSLAPDTVSQYGERQVTLATVLPLAEPAISRPDGRVLVGLQRDGQSGDVNRDIAAALLAALAAAPGAPVDLPATPGDGPRLADVLVDGPLEITLHDRFDFWLDEESAADSAVSASLERANASIYPTTRMDAARAAYWCQVAERAHLRWVLAEPEELALPALARVSAAGGMKLDDQTRFAGMFRAHGMLVPVWDLPREAPAGRWEEPLGAFAKRYAEALSTDGDLTPDERRARQGLVGRQLTLR